LAFGSNVGFGEAKIHQGCYSKSLCLDTLRLAIFTKNAIDVNKLDGALAFQIHGKEANKRKKNKESNISYVYM
jgi:hypothetical protein